MNREHVRGTADKIKGNIKEGAGKLTGDKKMEAEGKFDKAKGIEDLKATVSAARNIQGSNGKVATIEDAVMQMAEYQTGKELAVADRDDIITWLKTLSGEVDATYIKEPDLPKSTAKTPRPKA